MTVRTITPEFLAQNPLPVHDSAGDKGSRGRVLVIGGSVEVPGAVLLAGTAALRAGAGILQIATSRTVAPHVGIALPEALVIGLPETHAGEIDPAASELLIQRVSACKSVLIGPGMMDREAAGRLTSEIIAGAEGPVFVVDAAALTGLRDDTELLRSYAGRVVITPHAGEMATFLNVGREDVVADPLGAARQVAQAAQCVVVMKGARTHIVSPAGEAWSCEEGNVGLATSGSGDVLAGIISGLLARGASPVTAAQWGVYMHAAAGDRLAVAMGQVGFLARELLAEIPSLAMPSKTPALGR